MNVTLSLCEYAPILEEKWGFPTDCATVPYIYSGNDCRDDQQGNQEEKDSKRDKLGSNGTQSRGDEGEEKFYWGKKDRMY
jgi:hypothetical protein